MNVDDYLSRKLAAAIGKQADSWRQLQDLYSKKSWHPLTQKVKECVNDPEFIKNEDMIDIHDKFIREFEHRSNPLTLTEIIIVMAHHIPNKKEAVKFIESVKNVVKNHPEAAVLLLVGAADVKLTVRDADRCCPLIKEVQVLLDEAQLKLDGLPGVTAVHGPFYKAHSVYMREVGDFAGYYREALRYLGCVDINKMTNDERYFHAYCLGIAAILGENVYNFGELLAHPILDSLKGTSNYYIVDLLYAFNAGNLSKFNYLRPQWTKQDDLAKQCSLLDRKIRLLALMEMSFARSARNRRLAFEEIARATDVKINEVEHLAMKALSLGLISGYIDGIDRVVEVTWVQPRVLDKKQILVMSAKFGQWAADVKQTSLLVEEQAKEIIIQS